MGINKWLGAVLITSVFGLAGCNTPKPTTDASPVVNVTTSPVVVESPVVVVVETPVAGETPAASGSPVAMAGDDDFANAEGMAGYEEVLAIKVVPSTPESVEKGKGLFLTNCASCHGADGSGGGEAGKALDPPPRNLHAGADYKYGSSEHGVYRTVYYGVDGTGMAPWGEILSEEEIWNLVHFVRTQQS